MQKDRKSCVQRYKAKPFAPHAATGLKTENSFSITAIVRRWAVMRVLEALKILEDAVLDCRERPIDTPQTRQALDLFEPYISPKYVVRKFRDGLFVPNRRDYYLEGQQHNLDHWFRAIHRSIRALLAGRVLELCDRSAKTGDQRMKAELERLSAELERLPLKWEFIPRSSRH